MAEDQMQLPAPETSREDWLLPILVFFGAFVILLLLVMSNQGTASGLSVADKNISIGITEPEDGAQVPSHFVVRFAAEGVIVEPAGEIHDGAGHFHVLINEDFIPAGEVIPNDETHLHFGDGAMQAVLDLPPGTYTLRLQFADGAHQALAGDQYRDVITITVSE